MQINYTNTISEIKRGYTLFHRKYALPKMLLPTIFSLLALFFGFDFIRRGSLMYGLMCLALGGAWLTSTWVRPLMARSRLVAAVEALDEEKYSASFYEDRIEIVTQITNASASEEPKADTSVMNMSQELFSVEDNEIFCLFVNKALIYIFPKRCMNAEQISELQKYFKEKAI